MDLEKKLEIVKRNTVEIVTENELIEALSTDRKIKGYIGFEPSGIAHIGHLLWMFKFKDLVNVGVEMILFPATWHAWINDKLGGDLELIRASAQHFIKMLEAIGVDRTRFRVVYSDELVEKREYWEKVLRLAKRVSLSRVKRALTIMGRRADEAELDFAKLIYPFMQVADIFELGVDIALGGIDQRKAHMLARDVAEKFGWRKPIAIHTPLLPSLRSSMKMAMTRSDVEIDDIAMEVKMSKSKPEDAILITDSDEEIRKKIKQALCPPRDVLDNPVMLIAKYIIFAEEPKRFVIEREAKYGGTIEVYTYRELEELYVNGKLHPLDLKNAVAEELIKIIKPIRDTIQKDVTLWKNLLDIEKSITR
ncbi:MAG: tyrosine--tRNA ligase [Desulfurococcaceae archaeon]|jgi:tyrosyl-tRNA synthetase|nr:tyrosine--tRNA ligase [Desulfurococcaceae archaeon]